MLIPQIFRRLTAAFGSIIKLYRQLQWAVVLFANFGGPFEPFCARISGDFAFRDGLLEAVSMHIFVIIVSTIVLYYRFIREFLLYALIGTAHLGSHHIDSDFPGKALPLGVFLCVFGGEARPKQMLSSFIKWYSTVLLFTKHRVVVFAARIRLLCIGKSIRYPLQSDVIRRHRLEIHNCKLLQQLSVVSESECDIGANDCVHHTVGACERKQ